MLKFLLLFVIVLFFISTLLPQTDIGLLISILCMIIILCTFWNAKRFVQILGSTFLVLGFVLLLTSGAHWYHYFLSFGPMLDLLTLFTLVPILGIPIKIGGYSNSIETIIQKKVKTSGILYILTSGISYFFSIFMNLATLPMTYYSISPMLKSFPIKHENRFMSRAITRGFAMPLIWAPVTPIVGIVIAMTGVSWVSILPYVIPLSILGIILDWYIGARKSNKKINEKNDISVTEMAAAAEYPNNNANRPGRVFQILLAIIIFTVLISFAEAQFTFSFLILVSLMVIPFSFIWSILLKKGREFIVQLLDHFQSFSDSMKDQFFIYLSAGFFISTIKVSHTDELLNSWIIGVINVIGVEFFLILLPLIPLGFAFLGLHPAVSLSLMAGALNPSTIGISPQILTVAMLAGAVSAFLVGPYNATIGLMGNITKESSYKISNWNLSFTLLFVGCVMVYLFILERLLA